MGQSKPEEIQRTIHSLTPCGENYCGQCIQVKCIKCNKVFDNVMLAFKSSCSQQ